MQEISFVPIGKIITPFDEPEGTPIQPPGAGETSGQVEVYREYAEGLKDIEGFSHLILLYYCHRAGKCSLLSKPFMEQKEHGIFSIRAPSRPNSIGLSIVRLVKREGNILHIKEVDILNNTPLLDIKPYVPQFDHRENVRIGWLEDNVKKVDEKRDDGRFADK